MVDEQIYPGMGHTINGEEIAWASKLLTSFRAEGP